MTCFGNDEKAVGCTTTDAQTERPYRGLLVSQELKAKSETYIYEHLNRYEYERR